jgi:glycosyltransferase 2 family protein
MNLRRITTWISGPLIAVFFLWLSFRGVELADLMAQIRGAHWGWLVLFVGSAPVHMLARSWRWRTLLTPVRPDVPIKELFSATTIGYMASLLPGRVGEVLRPVLLARRVGLPAAPAISTVATERIVLDLLAVVISGALALLLPSSVSGLGAHSDAELLVRLRGIGAVLLAAGLGMLVVVHLMGRFRASLAVRLETLASRLPGRVLPGLVRWVASLLPGFVSLSTLPGMARVAAQTAVVWAVIAVGLHAGIVSCGVDLPPFGVLVMLPILAIGIGLPTPGGTGTFHLAMKLGLVSLFGVDEAVALGAALVVHAFNWLPMLAMGGWSVARGGLVRPEAAVESELGPAGEVAP